MTEDEHSQHHECSPASWRLMGHALAIALTTLIALNVASVVIDSIQSIKHGK